MKNKYMMIVVLEGPDGAGKSTMADLLCKQIEQYTSFRCLSLSPSRTPSGEKIVSRLQQNDPYSKEVEQRLWLKSMEEVVEQIQNDQRETVRSTVYIIDRWTLSTSIYQNKVYNELPNYLGVFPSDAVHTLIIDADDEILDQRLAERDFNDKYEQPDVQQRIRSGYRQYRNDPRFKHFNLNQDAKSNMTRLFSHLLVVGFNTIV